MKFKSMLLLGTACLMTACQSNTYKITGTIEGLEPSDTLYLTYDMETGAPSDTIIVENGRFSMEGQADSVKLAMIYSARHNERNANFFIEPGEIHITISEQHTESRVGGTPCNEQWQELLDSVVTIGKRINVVAEHIYGNTVSKEEQERGMARIEKMEKHFADVVVNFARKNIKNEFGYFLLTFYPEDLIDNATRMELFKQLPENMRQRPLVKQMEKAIEQKQKTAAGTKLPDFTLPGTDGNALSINELVKQNQLTVIDFWASWCGPCRHDMPQVVALYNAYHSKGLGIVGISLDQDASAWKKAISDMQMTWPQMSDLKGWDNAAAKLFDITSIPHTIVVDQQGIILARGLRGEDLKQFVEERLK